MLLAETPCTSTRQSPQTATRLRVLVLCTGNSARSIMTEAIFNSLGAPLFQAYSAGSQPTGKVNPLAIEQISQLELPGEMELRSKSWQEFARTDAPELDLVLTVCDNAAAESCPAFAGNYEHIHWGFADPAGSSSDIQQERQAFARCFKEIKLRVKALVALHSPHQPPSTLINAMRELATRG